MDKEIAVGEPAVPVEEDGPVEQADEDRHDEGLAGEGPAHQNQPAHQERKKERKKERRKERSIIFSTQHVHDFLHYRRITYSNKNNLERQSAHLQCVTLKKLG